RLFRPSVTTKVTEGRTFVVTGCFGARVARFTGTFQLARDVEAGNTSPAHGGRRLPPARGRGRRTTDEKLRQVTDVYRAAVAAGKRPTQAVADQLHYKRAHAGRLVMQARQAGFLGPAVKGKAGEH
ncbi:MAG: hypothetical protein ACREQ5_22790, partial [Candidatus Dormibacteria bacterium]